MLAADSLAAIRKWTISDVSRPAELGMEPPGEGPESMFTRRPATRHCEQPKNARILAYVEMGNAVSTLLRRAPPPR